MLDGLLVAGLGLAAFMLARLPVAESVIEFVLRPSPALVVLLGLVDFFATPLAAFAGAGCAMTVAEAGLTNIPFAGSHSK